MSETSLLFEDDFNAFWAEYPKKLYITEAWEAWCDTEHRRPPIADITAAIKAEIKANGGRYLPMPSAWLRKGGWANVPLSLDEEDSEKTKRYRDNWGMPTYSLLVATVCSCGGAVVCDPGPPILGHLGRYCQVCGRNYACMGAEECIYKGPEVAQCGNKDVW